MKLVGPRMDAHGTGEVKIMIFFFEELAEPGAAVTVASLSDASVWRLPRGTFILESES